jgi:hypothetical protein
MRTILSRLLLLCAGILLLTANFSCKPKPERKKMPQFDGLGVSEEETPVLQQTEGFPVYTHDVTIMVGSDSRDFLAIGLPDPAFDSSAAELVRSQVPMADYLLKTWVRTAGRGICIDLRGGGDASRDQHRADFTLQDADGVSVPVVFLWDRSSAGRADHFIDLLHSARTITCQPFDSGSNQF